MVRTRRQFFVDVVRGIVPVADTADRHAEQPSCSQQQWLRPPGAVAEADFLNTCTRCTDCIEACPFRSIRRLGTEFGEKLAGTPAIIPDEAPCYLCADLPCINACQPQALNAMSRPTVNMGTAKLQREACYVARNQPCDYCVTRCPLKGVAIEWGADRLPVIHEAGCTGCAVCAYLCPANALSVTPAQS